MGPLQVSTSDPPHRQAFEESQSENLSGGNQRKLQCVLAQKRPRKKRPVKKKPGWQKDFEL
jgi:hypothetical protein